MLIEGGEWWVPNRLNSIQIQKPSQFAKVCFGFVKNVRTINELKEVTSYSSNPCLTDYHIINHQPQ